MPGAGAGQATVTHTRWNNKGRHRTGWDRCSGRPAGSDLVSGSGRALSKVRL